MFHASIWLGSKAEQSPQKHGLSLATLPWREYIAPKLFNVVSVSVWYGPPVFSKPANARRYTATVSAILPCFAYKLPLLLKVGEMAGLHYTRWGCTSYVFNYFPMVVYLSRINEYKQMPKEVRSSALQLCPFPNWKQPPNFMMTSIKAFPSFNVPTLDVWSAGTWLQSLRCGLVLNINFQDYSPYLVWMYAPVPRPSRNRLTPAGTIGGLSFCHDAILPCFEYKFPGTFTVTITDLWFDSNAFLYPANAHSVDISVCLSISWSY